MYLCCKVGFNDDEYNNYENNVYQFVMGVYHNWRIVSSLSLSCDPDIIRDVVERTRYIWRYQTIKQLQCIYIMIYSGHPIPINDCKKIISDSVCSFHHTNHTHMYGIWLLHIFPWQRFTCFVDSFMLQSKLLQNVIK